MRGRYFCAVRAADSFDDGDAIALGRILFLNMFPHREREDVLREKIDQHIRIFNVLRSAQAKYRYGTTLVPPPPPRS